MKLYTLSTFECQGYTTANWFFATSREEAERLIEEAVEKVKDAIQKLERAYALDEELWKGYEDLSLEYGIDNRLGSWNVTRIKYPEKYKEYTTRRENMREQIQKGYAWKMLYKVKSHYSDFNREELLHEGIDELKKRIIEIDANKVLPLIQTDGD